MIPMAGLPFVGRGLSPSLFEPSALARAERGGRLPLALRFRARLHAPAGGDCDQDRAATSASETPAGWRCSMS